VIFGPRETVTPFTPSLRPWADDDFPHNRKKFSSLNWVLMSINTYSNLTLEICICGLAHHPNSVLGLPDNTPSVWAFNICLPLFFQSLQNNWGQIAQKDPLYFYLKIFRIFFCPTCSSRWTIQYTNYCTIDDSGHFKLFVFTVWWYVYTVLRL
jgi:hypothetical protein